MSVNPPALTLIVRGPNSPPRIHRVPPQGGLVIGRAEDNDVVLSSDSVSRRHAQLVVGAEGTTAVDLGSRNGTLLNGRALGGVPRRVRAGDVLSVGEYRLKLEGDRSGSSRSDGFVTLMSGPLSQNSLLAARPADASAVTPERPARALYRVAELIASSPPRTRLFDGVLEAASDVTGFEQALVLLSREGETELAAARGDDPPRWSRTIVTEAVKRRSAMLVRHLPTDPRFSTVNSVVLTGVLRVLCVPLLQGGACVGALYLSTRGSQLPDEESVEGVTAIGQLLAASLLRADALDAARLRHLADQANFARGALIELGRLIDAYRSALVGGRSPTPAQIAELGALEEEIGLVELLEEAPRALEDLAGCAGAAEDRDDLAPGRPSFGRG